MTEKISPEEYQFALQRLRDKVWALYQSGGWNFSSMARAMNISRLTLLKFMKGGNLKYVTFWKIEEFIGRLEFENKDMDLS